MSPARRSSRRRDWPRGLYEVRPGYFIWREPGVGGKQHTLGAMAYAQARHEALMANEAIAARRSTLVQRLSGETHTVAMLLEQLPVATKANTAKGHRSHDKHIIEAMGSMLCLHVQTKHCAELIEALVKAGKPRMAQAVRSRLVGMCQRGAELGWMTGNVAEVTKRPDAEVQRSRLSLAQFQAIYAKAPEVADWLQAAMMLALVTGQDRSTVVAMKRGQVTTIDGERMLVVQRSKTEDTNDPVAIPLRLRLAAVDVTLADLLQSLATLRSPFYVHHQRNYGNAPIGAPVFADRLTKAFTEARALAGIPDEIGGKDAPTFHEIRSLSKRLYDKQGGVDTKVLLGHSTDEAAALYGKSRGSEIKVVRLG